VSGRTDRSSPPPDHLPVTPDPSLGEVLNTKDGGSLTGPVLTLLPPVPHPPKLVPEPKISLTTTVNFCPGLWLFIQQPPASSS
jgi:hypothetical protein